jgi:UDP-N-acetylmuramate: L-alanyl-gamma-D-glutamyl-meso-diaminopimelate ligase
MLDELGIEYAHAFSPANLEPAPELVVVGNAISRGNVELEAVLDCGLRFTSAAATVREEFLWGKHVLAVAGTHGKTTTTSLLAWLLEVGGLNPGFLIGGVAENFGASARLTESGYFVIEADEYDTAYFDKGPKMWHYLPRTAVVTNVEFDHADIYRDERAYRFAFERFVNLVPRSGSLIVGWESPIARALAGSSPAPVSSFGITELEAASAADPLWRASGLRHSETGTGFFVHRGEEELGWIETPISGAFNVRNALAAIAAATSVGVDWIAVQKGMRTFRSVRRRMELKGIAGDIRVIDDFAHHPTAVRETIEAARARFPGGRLFAILEPRSYTAQRREFQEPFRDALRGADRVYLAGLFHPERYDRNTGMDPLELVEGLRASGIPADYLSEVDRIVESVASEARPGDTLLVMSNGGFGGIHGKLLAALES